MELDNLIILDKNGYVDTENLINGLMQAVEHLNNAHDIVQHINNSLGVDIEQKEKSVKEKSFKIKEDIIKILASAEVEGNKLILTGELDRNTYQAVNKVLVAIGGKWNTKEKAHIFKTDIEDILQEIITTGKYTDNKKEFQFYPTPEELAKYIVSKAEIQAGEQCLEPSAGTGNIAKFMPNCDCIEMFHENREYLQENGFNLIHDDFLTFEPQKDYDVIVMNPPFAKGQDIEHVTKAINLAKRCVVAIVSLGVLHRDNAKNKQFRKLVSDYNGTIERLPKNSFKTSGTNINTALVIINKKLIN